MPLAGIDAARPQAASGAATLFITGDSHVGALRKGHALLAAAGRLPDRPAVVFRPMGTSTLMRTAFFEDRSDHLEITVPRFREQVTVLPAPEFAASETVYCIAGPLNFHSLLSRKWWVHNWATGMPRRRGAPVTRGLLRHSLLAMEFHELTMVRRLRELGQQVRVIEAPAPFRHHPALAHTPAESLIALFRICREIIAAELDRIGIGILTVPAECLDDEGFMLPAFRHEKPTDGNHGNAGFGAIMLARLLSAVTCVDSAASGDDANTVEMVAGLRR